MGPDSIVVLAPLRDCYLGFPQRAEDLAVQQLVLKPTVEALTVAILPWAARRDLEGLGADTSEPPTQLLYHHLRAIVAAVELRHTSIDHHVGEDIDDVVSSDGPWRVNRE